MTGRFRLLHLRRFRTHTGRTALSIVGVTVGTALLTAILGLHASLVHSVERMVDLAGRADVQVAAPSDTGFDEALYFDVARTEGVETAVPVIRSTVRVAGEDVMLFGFDERARALGADLAAEIDRRAGTQETNGLFLASDLAGDLGLEQGDEVTVYGNGQESRTTVVGVVGGGAFGVNGGHVAAAPLPLAQRLAGKADRLDVIWAVAAPGVPASELQLRLHEQVGEETAVTSPSTQADLATEELGAFTQQLLVIAAAVLVVAAFLIFNTMSMAALERRRELATLRALGGRRRSLLGGFLLEAGLLGLAGAGLGVLLGIPIARAVVARVPAVLTSGLGVEVGFHLPRSVVPITLATGVVAAVAAAFVPARRAVSVPPVEAMRPEGVFETAGSGDRTAWPVAAGGVVMAVVGAALTAGLFPGAVSVGAALLVIGALVATWGFTAPITVGAAAVARRAGRSGPLAAAAIARSPRRVWATTAGVAVAGMLVVAIGGIVENERRTMTAWFDGLDDMDLLVQTSPLDDVPSTTLMPPEWEGQLEAIPGVEEVDRGQFAFTTVETRRTLLEGILLGGNEPLYRLADTAGRRALADKSGAVVTTEFSRHLGIEEGDDLEFATPGGLERIRVADVVPYLGGGVTGGIVAVHIELLEGWFGRSGASWYELVLEPGADVEAVAAAAEELVAGAPFPVWVATGQELFDATVGLVEQFDSIFTAMAWIAAGAAALGILNTLMLSVLERRRELGILRALGTSRRQVRGMVLGEAGAIAVLGSVLGSAVGLVMHYAGIQGADELLGVDIAYVFTLGPLAGAAVIAVLMSAAGGLLPGRRAARVNVIEAIGYE